MFPVEIMKMYPLTAEAESLLSERALSTSHRESRSAGDFLPDCAASFVFLHLDFWGAAPMSHLGQSTWNHKTRMQNSFSMHASIIDRLDHYKLTSRREKGEFFNRNVFPALSFQDWMSQTRASSRLRGSSLTGMPSALRTSSERLSSTGIRPPSWKGQHSRLTIEAQPNQVWFKLEYASPGELQLPEANSWPCQWHPAAVDSWADKQGCSPLPAEQLRVFPCCDVAWGEETQA